MKRQLAFLLVSVVVLLLSNFVTAASRASFCKCTCKTNSTIIALDNPPNTNNIDPGTPDSSSRDILTGIEGGSSEDGDDGKPRQRSCADCNRQFCLMYDLPKLDDCRSENRGREDEIVATCFQRDSAKDQAVVYTFIFVTIGLLVYAAVRPYIEKRMDPSRQDSVGYEQVPTRQTGLGTG